MTNATPQTSSQSLSPNKSFFRPRNLRLLFNLNSTNMPAGRDDGRNHGRMYINSDVDPNCFIGQLDDDEQLSESEIRDYIKYSKPDLFKKLNDMPIKSTDLISFKTRPPVSHPQYTPRSDQGMQAPIYQARRDDRPLRERFNESNPPAPFTHIISLLRSTKTRIEQKLSSEYIPSVSLS